jgi:hypothetical protein
MIVPRRVSSSISLVRTPTSIPNPSVSCLLAKVQYGQGILWIVRMCWSIVPYLDGKRDSQMLLMHFLNKVLFLILRLVFSSPPFTNLFYRFTSTCQSLNPLELEMYHQIKNVIGVNPSFYEYLFMVDADYNR